MRAVDVVIPVYDGLQETIACLESVLRTVNYPWARIIIINDGSPNPEICAHLVAVAERNPGVVLLENESNLGFVATVNRGMAYDPNRDVLLLNSDVEVAGDWLHRMRTAAYHHEKVASVTPFSNNATVCSFPDICENNPLIFGLGPEEIDSAFNAEFDVDDVFQLPTGVGCCMYLMRDCLDVIGFFDVESFGRGYGEENDWCQRAESVGRRNLHLANCFVFHHGGVSFREEHSPRLADALDVLDKKYPRYHGEIQSFIARDPAREARVRGWLHLFATQDKPKILLVCHKLGGGAQQHVDELARVLGDSGLFLLLVPDKDGHSIRLSCFDGRHRLRDGLFFDAGGAEYDKLVTLLRGLGLGRIHYHHTLGLPDKLLYLAEDVGCEFDVTIHDYYLVNANATLTDSQARFVDEGAADFEERCAQNIKLPEPVDLENWRSAQAQWIAAAARTIFPSVDCKNRFLKFYDVQNPVVAWHPDFSEAKAYPLPGWRFPSHRPLRVVVIGALSREKGADVLEAAANALVAEPIEFHLLGYAYRRLGNNVVFHGPYDSHDVHALIDRINPDVAWYPAQWPETYSYTLSVALEKALPVVVPDIGAFVERVQGRPFSSIVPWDFSAAQWKDYWLGVLHAQQLPAQNALASARTSAPDLAAEVDRDFYAAAYVQAVPLRPAAPSAELLGNLQSNLVADSQNLSRSERLLRAIWRLSLRPSAARLIAMVPFRIQRTIKRSLSQRPMHDIVGE
ncbi:MAG: glycosyltransferase [Gammaproteobacteria bacterium]|nr:glycosyltransferase [Gammaproteobacteria bacterium]